MGLQANLTVDQEANLEQVFNASEPSTLTYDVGMNGTCPKGHCENYMKKVKVCVPGQLLNISSLPKK